MSNAYDELLWLQEAFCQTLYSNEFQLIVHRYRFKDRKELTRMVNRLQKAHILLTNDSFCEFVHSHYLFVVNLTTLNQDQNYKMIKLNQFKNTRWPLRPCPVPFPIYSHVNSILHKISLNRLILAKVLEHLNNDDKSKLYSACPFLKLKSRFI